MFFVFTFFTIGIVSNFKKLWEEGIGRLMVVYVVALFGFIIWVGLVHFVALLPWSDAAVGRINHRAEGVLIMADTTEIVGRIKKDGV